MKQQLREQIMAAVQGLNAGDKTRVDAFPAEDMEIIRRRKGALARVLQNT